MKQKQKQTKSMYLETSHRCSPFYIKKTPKAETGQENGQESYLKDDNESLQKSTFKMNKRQ